MPIFAMFSLVLTFGLLALPASADVVACDLQQGCLGLVRIGDSLPAIEKRIGRKLELQFAGDDRAGVSFEARQDLRQLGFALPAVSSVKSADIFFETRSSQPVIDMVSLEVSCEDVRRLRYQARAEGISTLTTAKSGWRVDERMKPQAFVWGGETTPVCRVWVRRGGLRR